MSLFSPRKKAPDAEVLLKLTETWEYLEPSPGDLVRADRGHYHHYGIYMADGSVIAFGEGDADEWFDPRKVAVSRASLADFLKGSFLEVRCMGRKEKRYLRPVIDRLTDAEAAIGRGGYDFRRNNCEHFVNELAFGVAYSREADAFMALLRQKLKQTPANET